MVEVNPFSSISPRKEETLLGIDESKLKDLAKQLTEGNIILIISGGSGSGKSLVEMKIEDEIPKKIKTIKLVCTPKLPEELNALKLKDKTVVVIEKFHMVLALGEQTIRHILDTIGEMLNLKTSFLITATPELAAAMPHISNKIRNVRMFEIPPLSFEDANKLVASRLNKIRAKPSHDITPFTEHELMHIWKTSRGNPKLILLLCASLYETKGQLK